MEERSPQRNEKAIQGLQYQMNLLEHQLRGAGNDTGQQEAAKKQAAEAEKKRLQNLEGSLTAKSKQLANSNDDVVATPLDAKIASLSSYAPIDFEKEKQRILDSYSLK